MGAWCGFLADYYLILKAVHIVAVISWMAGLLYLPRLYVYHAKATIPSELSDTFKIMERRLLRVIMNPAMIVTFITGILLLCVPGIMASPNGWLHGKLFLVLLMAGFHGALSKWRKDFMIDKNMKSHLFFRYANEVPTILMIVIVFLVVLKPF